MPKWPQSCGSFCFVCCFKINLHASKPINGVGFLYIIIWAKGRLLASVHRNFKDEFISLTFLVTSKRWLIYIWVAGWLSHFPGPSDISPEPCCFPQGSWGSERLHVKFLEAAQAAPLSVPTWPFHCGHFMRMPTQAGVTGVIEHSPFPHCWSEPLRAAHWTPP